MENRKPSAREILRESLNSEGTNPGRIRLNPIRWISMYPIKILKMLGGLVISLMLAIKFHWLFSILFIGFLLWNLFYWFNSFLRFKVGDVNPGKVISINPDRIAVATNMTKGFGNYPILKILNIKLRKEDRVMNKILPTIAGYTNNPHGYPFWAEFNPVPMNHGIMSKKIIEHYSNTYGEEEIKELNGYIIKVESKNPETYKIDEETTDWVNFKNVKVGNLDEMYGPEKLENKD